jgi:predicted signal transduction protein with EAL and GGDEF domain
MMLRHKTVDDIVEFLKLKITKEINAKASLIPVIERINTEAEIFFIKELGNMNIKAYRHSQRIRTQEKAPKSSSEEREPIVKAE